MKKSLKRLTAGIAAVFVCSGAVGKFLPEPEKIVFAAESSKRLCIDLNAGDGRKASYSKVAENWIATGDAPTATIGGVTLKLSNGGSVGSEVRMVN